MKRSHLLLLGLFFLLTLGGYAATRSKVTSVQGNITLPNHDANGLMVQFWHPDNPREPIGGQGFLTDENGHFEVTAAGGRFDFPPGEYIVRIIDTKNFNTTRVPLAYWNRTSPLRVVLGRGANDTATLTVFENP